jgi:CspA family cold shock protein
VDLVSGTVRVFSDHQGFGLIAPDGGASEIVVHVSVLERAGIERLNHGQRVRFELEADRHGRAAARSIQLI